MPLLHLPVVEVSAYSSVKELVLSMLVEMLKNQKDVMESSVNIVIEKLLNVIKDRVPKVSNEAEHCLCHWSGMLVNQVWMILNSQITR
nr:CLIP-associated protein-like isoform X3 [Arachis hypogaea]